MELKGISLRDYDEMNARQLIKKLSNETLSVGASRTASSQNETLSIQTMPNKLLGLVKVDCMKPTTSTLSTAPLIKF